MKLGKHIMTVIAWMTLLFFTVSTVGETGVVWADNTIVAYVDTDDVHDGIQDGVEAGIDDGAEFEDAGADQTEEPTDFETDTDDEEVGEDDSWDTITPEAVDRGLRRVRQGRRQATFFIISSLVWALLVNDLVFFPYMQDILARGAPFSSWERIVIWVNNHGLDMYFTSLWAGVMYLLTTLMMSVKGTFEEKRESLRKVAVRSWFTFSFIGIGLLGATYVWWYEFREPIMFAAEEVSFRGKHFDPVDVKVGIAGMFVMWLWGQRIFRPLWRITTRHDIARQVAADLEGTYDDEQLADEEIARPGKVRKNAEEAETTTDVDEDRVVRADDTPEGFSAGDVVEFEVEKSGGVSAGDVVSFDLETGTHTITRTSNGDITYEQRIYMAA